MIEVIHQSKHSVSENVDDLKQSETAHCGMPSALGHDRRC